MNKSSRNAADQMVALVNSNSYKLWALLARPIFALCGGSAYERRAAVDLANDMLDAKNLIASRDDLLRCATAEECVRTLHEGNLRYASVANIAYTLQHIDLGREIEEAKYCPVVFL